MTKSYTFYVFTSLLHEAYGDRVVDDFGRVLSEEIGKDQYQQLHRDFERIAKTVDSLSRVGIRMTGASSHNELQQIRIASVAKSYLTDAGFDGDDPDAVNRCMQSLQNPLNQIEAFLIELNHQ